MENKMYTNLLTIESAVSVQGIQSISDEQGVDDL